MFGDDGLTSHTDVISFDEAVERFRRDKLPAAPSEFQDYFDRRLRVLLRANVQAGRTGWTNNNAESVNHVLKQFTQWKPQQLPDLIDKLRQLVTGQFHEADRAIVGRGDLMLAASHAKHRLTVDVWSAMSDVQRGKASKACFRPPAPPSSTSTDGSLTVPLTPGAGKKPHQKRRRRAEKSVTKPKMPRIAEEGSDADFC